MTNQEAISIQVETEKGEKEFRIRFINSEGVGLLSTKDNTNYLMLDSADYWYELTSAQKPPLKKCSCKNNWFTVQFAYFPREGTADIRKIEISWTCTQCAKKSRPVTIDIKYSPTKQLIEQPLTYCKNPFPTYNYSRLACAWNEEEIKAFFHFMINVLKLDAYCWYWADKEQKRHLDKVDCKTLSEIYRSENTWYLRMYFTPAGGVKVNEKILGENEKGIYMHEDIWRQCETIEIEIPVSHKGETWYTIVFSNQNMVNGDLAEKPDHFKEITRQVTEWINGEKWKLKK